MTYDEALNRQRLQGQRSCDAIHGAAELLLEAAAFDRTAALAMLDDVRALIWRDAEAWRQKHETAEALRAEVGY